MNRRLALKLLTASSVNLAIPDIAEDKILEQDCTDLLGRIRDGSLSAEQVCERFLQQYERQRSLNTVTWIDRSTVLSVARGVDQARDKGIRLPPLAGLPILVKDNIDTVGFPTSAGTPSLKEHFPQRNAPVVEKLLKQGAIVMGKTNMHELAFGVTSSNPTFGFVHNPYNPKLIPGGSSGGSAAALAARIAPLALGTDTGGSVRIPAALCGVVGLRPSTYPRNLYSQQGVVPASLNLDTIGPMGRTVTDVTLLHTAIVHQRPIRLRSIDKVRIGIPRRGYWDDLNPDVERVAQAALKRLRHRDAVLVEINLSEINDVAWKIFAALVSGSIVDIENYLRAHVPSISMRDLIEQIASRDVHDYLARLASSVPVSFNDQSGRDAVREAYCESFRQSGIQAVAFPTEVLLPPSIRAAGDDPDDTIEFNGRVVPKGWILGRNTVLAAVLGAPALSLPAGLTSSGMPVALELDGLPGRDCELLALGERVEAIIGRVRPPRRAVPGA